MSSDDIISSAGLDACRVRVLLIGVGLVVALAAVMPGAAGATDRFTLDSSPAGPAEIAIDASGTGYFGWVHNPGGGAPDQAMFCKVARGGTCSKPIVLPGGAGNSGDTDGAFPVLGSGSTVYVVGPRFIQQDVVVWTSTDGGVTFGAPVLDSSGGVSAGSDPTDVLAAPSGGFYVSSHNPGLTFTSVPASGGPAPVTDLTPAGGLTSLSGSAVGLTSTTGAGDPVEAFSLLNTTPQTVNFRSYSGSGAGGVDNAANWSATAQVSQGTLPSLAGGPSGLFLTSQDVSGAGLYNQVDVRKYTPGAGFGAPLATLQTDTSSDNSGQIFQTAGGRLLVAWQGKPRADGGVAIRLYDSTTGGASFTRVGDVAEGSPFVAIADFRLAAADDGQGFVSFNEIAGAGLRVADLTPIKSATSTVTSLSTAGHTAAAKITVGPGTPVIDTATIQSPPGTTATTASGAVAYSVYSDPACKSLLRTAGTAAVIAGTASPSLPISLPIGTWYYLAQYSGDAADLASTSTCGAETVTVSPASVGVAGIIFVGGNIIINARFNTAGTLRISSQVANVRVLYPPGPPVRTALAAATKQTNRCKTGQARLKVGHKTKCVSTSLGTTTKTIPAAGAYKIRLSPNAAAQKAITNGRTLHVKVTLTFKPKAGGKPVITTHTINIHSKKH